MFIGITSGPHHTHLRHAIRNTWAIPCRLSADCDYRFFVDAPTHKLSPELQLEAITHNDMVFRGACSLMNRHSDHINYGNSPPVGGNLHRIDDNDTSPSFGESVDNPDYPARRLFKVDWKVCFMQWSQAHYSAVGVYVFVEDDSFACTENLLHQFRILKNMTVGGTPEALSQHNTKYTFRMGTPMFDGFDDSSTIMDARSAAAFAEHYPSPRMHCLNVENSTDKGLLESTVFLSWGNSFRKAYCNWLGQLAENFNMSSVRVPTVTCTHARVARNGVVEFQCLDQPLILHHTRAPELVLRKQTEARMRHSCEFMWLIDKVKEPEQMFQFWNLASLGRRYHNFSALFTASNDRDAWRELLSDLQVDEDLRQHQDADCQRINSTLRFPCIFEGNVSEEEGRRMRRALLTNQRLIADGVTYRDYFKPPLV